MPNYLAEIYADDAEIAVLGAIALLASIGIYLVLRRIVIGVQRRRRLKPDADLSEGISYPPGQAPWDWQCPVDPATERVPSSQLAALSDTAHPNVRPSNAKYQQFGVRVEHFDASSEAWARSSVARTSAFASATDDIPQSGRLATSIREIADYVYRQAAVNFAALSEPVLWILSRAPTQLAFAERGKRISGSAWDQLRRKAAQSVNPAHRGLKTTAQTGRSSLDPDPAIATASPSRVIRPIGLVLRLGAAICLAVPLGYAMTRQNWIERAPAISPAQGHANPEPSRSFELPASAALGMHGPAQGDGRTSVELLNSDLKATRAQIGAARAQAAAARELAGQEQRAAEGERARSAALQQALLDSSKQIDALRATMAAADNAHEERMRNELAAARTLDAFRRIAGDARTLLRETANYVFVEMPAAHLERQRAERLARDLSRARAQIEQLAIDAAKDRTKAKVSLAQASGMLDEERRKSADLRGDLAKVKLSNAALVKRADAAEQGRTGAVTARERAEQTAAETARALDRERAAAVSIHEDLDRVRRERDAARALVAGVADLKTALDKQREAAASLARDLAAARADNDRLRTERPSAQIEPPLRPRSVRAAAATGQLKAVSQKIARSKVRNPSRTTSVRSITLPYSLRPRQATLE